MCVCIKIVVGVLSKSDKLEVIIQVQRMPPPRAPLSSRVGLRCRSRQELLEFLALGTSVCLAASLSELELKYLDGALDGWLEGPRGDGQRRRGNQTFSLS